MRYGLFPVVFLLFYGCAALHHVQVGEIDNRNSRSLKPFEIKVSETGFNIKEAAQIGRAISQSQKGRQTIREAEAIWGYFHMGPTTGNAVFNDTYASDLVQSILEECPSGRVTGLVAIREMRKYPVISGEIIKIKGYCSISSAKNEGRSAR